MYKLRFVILSLSTTAIFGLLGFATGMRANLWAHQDTAPSHHATPLGQQIEQGGQNSGQGSSGHEHGTIEVPAGQTVPTVSLIAHPDSRRGWNLEMQVANFQLAPERVNQSSNTTEGHAHLYIDGAKITRLYGNWYYLESLAPGKHEVTVSLNANGHETLVHNGAPIQATVVIEVPVAAH